MEEDLSLQIQKQKLEIEQYKTRLEHSNAEFERYKIKHHEWQSGMDAAIAFANAAIKSLLLLNGAAAISLLALIGHMVRIDHYEGVEALVSALLYFGWGAFLGPAVGFLSYVAQFYYSQSVWDSEGEDKYSFSSNNMGQHIHYLAFLCAIMSLFLFLFGMYEAGNAFISLGAPESPPPAQQ